MPRLTGVRDQGRDDRLTTGINTIAPVGLPEMWQDHIVNDLLGTRVGEDRLEPVADLDPHLALGWRDDQQHAIVLAALADMPAIAESQPILVDRAAAERRRGDD